MVSKRVALITASVRQPRLNPFITAHVRNLVQPLAEPNIIVETVDIASFNLPLFDEPDPPAKHPREDPTPHYAHAHTRAWSACIRQYDAFVFVTPQYNWSIPAPLKNALDFLFHEWAGKPAGIVSYGGHGGGKAAAHLRDVLAGMKMRGVESAGALVITISLARESEERGRIDEERLKLWKESGQDEGIVKMFGELKDLLAGDGA
ncbi:MAG: hypothetical protein Q9162_006024 [Coniocarpon cinnabarinum]